MPGARNNRNDRQRLNDIRSAATSIVATVNDMEPEAMTTTIQTKAVQIDPMANQGAMIALMLTPEQIGTVRGLVGEMATGECDHVTLLYLADDVATIAGSKNDIVAAITECAKCYSPLQGTINGYGRFSESEGQYPLFLNYDSPQLADLRAELCEEVDEYIEESDHGFTPHITVAYLPAAMPMPDLMIPATPMRVEKVSLIWAGERLDFPLMGMGEEEDCEEDNGKVEIEINVKSAEKSTAEAQPVIYGLVRAIKSDGDVWALDVLGVPFGGHNAGRDSDGEYFSEQTKTYTEQFKAVPAIYFHGYDENNRPSSEPAYIGTASYSHVDNKGHWYRVVLDKASAYAKRVWEAAKQGVARASSGSITHLVRKGKDGHITHWPVAELSIFDAVGNRQPANQYAVALPVMKAVWTQAGLTLPDDIEPDSEQAPEDAAIGDGSTPLRGRASAKASETDNQQRSEVMENKTMDEVNVKDLVAQSVAEVFAQRDAAVKAEQDRQNEVKNAAKSSAEAVRVELEKQFEEERTAAKAAIEAAKAEAAEARRLPGGGEAPYQAKFGNLWKYDTLGIDDLAFAAGVLNSAKGVSVGGRMSTGPSEDLIKAMAVRIAETTGDEEREYIASKAAMKGAGMSMKANELNQSTLASYGDEWVGVTYSTQLWDKVRLAAPIAAQIPTVEIPQGSESIIIPVIGTSPTFYKVAQASAQDSNPGRVTPTQTTSRLNTAKQTLSVSKLGAAINYSGELEEDSFIPWVSELRRDIVAEAAEVMEHVILDGDTAAGATTNINDIGGTPAGTEAFMLFDGFRKLALVTNTANARSAGTLTLEDYLETLKLMGLGGRNAADKSKVAFITDMHTHWKSLELAEIKTRDVFIRPTIEEGMLTSIYGARVFASANMHRANQDATYGLKANTAGKVDLDTASNNTTGSILGVRFDQWRLGYKRRWMFEVQRDAISDSTVIVGTMRVGMVYRDTEASAVSYNITL